MTFSNPTPNANIRPASQPVKLNVGTLTVSADGGCGTTCVQPACSPSSCNLRLQMSGFDAGVQLTVTLHSDSVVLGVVSTDASGSATFEAPVPAGLTGEHVLEISGTAVAGGRQRASFRST